MRLMVCRSFWFLRPGIADGMGVGFSHNVVIIAARGMLARKNFRRLHHAREAQSVLDRGKLYSLNLLGRI
jgi:hypothetical protein